MTPRQAALQLRDAAVEAGFDRLRGLAVRVGRGGFEGRTYAMAATDGGEIILAPDMGDLPPSTVMGILVHEIGHILDYAYPAQWEPVRGGAMFHDDPVRPGAWRRRSYDAIERAADAIGEAVFGVRIGYRGPMTLQTIDGGARPRPAGLH